MVKISILVFLLASTMAHCKKLVINKCQLADGAVSYQEDSCQRVFTKEKIKKAPLLKTHKKTKPIKYSLNDKQLNNIIIVDKSVKKISNRVKGYKITLDALKNWSIVNKVYNNKLLHMKFMDNKFGNELSLMIDFIFPDNKVFSTKELTDIINLVGSRFVDGSKEGQINAYSINNIEGKGVIATFTHAAIEPNYKYSSKGIINKGDWLVQFTLHSNNIASYSHEFALQSLFKTLVIKKI